MLCKDISLENNTKEQAKKDRKEKIGISFALKNIVLALNYPEREELVKQAFKDHQFMHDSYNNAKEKRDKLVADNTNDLSLQEKIDPEQQTANEASLSRIIVLDHIKEYVENPIGSILISTGHDTDAGAEIKGVIATKNSAAKPDKVKEYYQVHLKIEEILKEARANGNEMAIDKAIDEFLQTPDRAMKQVGRDTVKKAHPAIKKAIEFYAPRYTQFIEKYEENIRPKK